MLVKKQKLTFPFPFSFLFLLFFLFNQPLYADICSAPYSDALQTHNTSGSGSSDIEFECGSQVLETSDKIFQTRGIELKSGSGSKNNCNTLTCESTHCAASGASAPTLNAGSFQTQSGGKDLTVKKKKTSKLGGKNKTNYKKVKVEENGTLNITNFGTSTKYHIEKLELEKNAVVNLVPGEYWIEECEIKSEGVKINVEGTGMARVFIKKDFKVDKNTKFNTSSGISNPAQKLWIYAYEKVEFDSDDLEIVGFVYSQESITLKKQSVVRGALVGKTIKLEKESKVYFDSGALQSACASPATHFTIQHDGAGTYCVEEAIQVTAKNGNAVSNYYNNTITLDTKKGRGSWRLISGNGHFVDETANDGVAHYTFWTQDNGVATFGLTYPEGTSKLKLAVYQSTNPSIKDDNTHPDLIFSPSGFLMTESPTSTTPYSAAQVAGLEANLYLKAFGYDPEDDTCGVIEEFTGNQNLDFWFDYVEPTTGTKSVTINNTPIGQGQTNATRIKVTFTDGIANITTNYRDVGRIRIYAKQGALEGATSAFVVKPGKLIIQATGNPGANSASGSVFKKAGEAFPIEIQVQDVDGNLTPNFGNEDTPETLVAKASQLVLPVGGRNGSYGDGQLLNGSAFTKVSGGVFQCTTCAYDEVGIIKLQANLADNDYLGAGDVPTKTESGPVGRFTPDHFEVAENVAPQWTTACAPGRFTYLDQPILYTTEGNIVVTAKAKADTTTQNYTGDFWKLAVSGLNTTYTSAGSVVLNAQNAQQDSAITETDNGDGSGSYTFSDGGGVRFEHTTATNLAPFDAEIAFEITVEDSDAVRYPNNPFQVGGATAGSGIAFSAGKNIRHGRVYLGTKLGSELESLSLPFEVQYYLSDSAGFVKHAQDSCTLINNANHILLTPESGLNTTATVSGFSDGQGELILSAPTPSGVTGYVDVEVDLSASGANVPWLQFDWPYDGNSDGLFDDNPKIRATFGKLGGSEGVIYQREGY